MNNDWVEYRKYANFFSYVLINEIFRLMINFTADEYLAIPNRKYIGHVLTDIIGDISSARMDQKVFLNSGYLIKSMNDLIRTAIAEKRIIEFDYDGYHRIAEPHIYGVLNGINELLTFQLRGGSSSGGIPDWRRFKLQGISNLKLLDEHFPGKRPHPSGVHSSFDRRFYIVDD